MEIATIGAQIRQERRKGPVNRLRKAGLIPAVVYGDKKDNINVSIQEKELRRVDLGSGQVFKVAVAGEGDHMVLIREIQKHPVTQRVTHLDLFEVSMTEKLTTTCAIAIIGEAKGVNEGGILQFGLREVEIECLPTDIPDSIGADVSALELGGILKVEDLAVPAGVVVLTDPDQLVASVVAAQFEAVETDEGEADADEGAGGAPGEATAEE